MSKKYHSILFCVLLLSLAACSLKKQNENAINYQNISLNSNDSLSTFLGLPTQIACKDSKLFWVDLFSDNKLITVFDIQKKDTLFSFGKKGEGPNEFIQISSIDLYEDKQGHLVISIFDPAQSKLGIYDYDSLSQLRDLYTPKTVKTNAIGFSLHEVLKTPAGYLATGMNPKGKYISLDNNLTTSNIFGEYRKKPTESIPDISNVLANYGKTVFSDDRNYFIEIVYKASILSCYQLRKDGANLQWEHVIHDLDYKMSGKSIVNNAPMGYLSACFIGDYIYALYSGELEDEDEIATYGKEIHKYDRNGHIVAKYSLDKSAFSFCIDKASKKMYLLSHQPEPSIWVYDMSAYL